MSGPSALVADTLFAIRGDALQLGALVHVAYVTRSRVALDTRARLVRWDTFAWNNERLFCKQYVASKFETYQEKTEIPVTECIRNVSAADNLQPIGE